MHFWLAQRTHNTKNYQSVPHRDHGCADERLAALSDSSCREQYDVPQVDEVQTADRIHQELRRSRTGRFLDQGGQNQVCGYCRVPSRTHIPGEQEGFTQAGQQGPDHQFILTNIHRVEEKLFQGGDMYARINYLQAELEDVMKIRKRGKYSGRSTNEDNKGDRCKKCTYKYGDGRCPVDGRKCNVCGADSHFESFPLCSGNSSSSNQRRTTTRRVEEQDRAWPGVHIQHLRGQVQGDKCKKRTYKYGDG